MEGPPLDPVGPGRTSARPRRVDALLAAHRRTASLLRLHTWMWLVLLAGLLLIAWIVVYTGGGTRTAWPHVFYFPIVLAALPFGSVGSVVAAVWSAVLCGPAMPLDTMAGVAQPLHNWLTRGGFFVAIGLVAGTTATARARIALLISQATRDPLTGIANRRLLDDELRRSIEQSMRHGFPVSVALVDLDHFKAVNDVHGHEAGDRALITVAERVTDVIRDGDVFGRWGGEEFLLVAPHTDLADMRELAERCRIVIRAEPVGSVDVTASIGIATLLQGDDQRSLLHRADEALYAAKAQGRDRVVARSHD